MRKTFAVLILTAGLALAADGGNVEPADAAPRASVCQEDQPCWNWVTMGNRRRGIVTRSGGRMIVNGCQFQRLMNSGRIDYRPRDVMRGDFTAMRLKCRPIPINPQNY